MQTSQSEEKSDFYEILNVSKNASKAEIRESFVRMQSTFSSQSLAVYGLFSEEETLRNLKRVEQAFRVLNDDMLRNEYDRRSGYLPVNEKRDHSFSNPWTNHSANELSNGFPSSQENHSVWMSGYNGTSAQKDLSIPIGGAKARVRASGSNNEALKSRYQEIIEGKEEIDGSILAELRQAAGVSLEEMQDRTKISINYLKAIESNTFEQLPSLIFIKGFVKSYLRYLMSPEIDLIVSKYATLVESQRHSEV